MSKFEFTYMIGYNTETVTIVTGNIIMAIGIFMWNEAYDRIIKIEEL